MPLQRPYFKIMPLQQPYLEKIGSLQEPYFFQNIFCPKFSKYFWQIIWVYIPNRSLYLFNSPHLDKIDLASSLPCIVRIMPLGEVENKSRTYVLALFSTSPQSMIFTIIAARSLYQFFKKIGLWQQSCPRPYFFPNKSLQPNRDSCL